jgi:hypothetical protein
MTEPSPKTILETVEVIRAVKSLFVEHNPYLPVYSALGGAFIGAVSSFFPNYLIHCLKERREKKSTTLQLYAEIKASLDLIEHRKYIAHLEQVLAAFAAKKITSYSYQVQVPEDVFPIFKGNLDRLGLLDIDIQVKVVEFYQLVQAVIQDVKPGGILNAQPATESAFEEVLYISKRAIGVGVALLDVIERRCRLSNGNPRTCNV